MSNLFTIMSEHLYREPTEQEVEMKKMHEHFLSLYQDEFLAETAFRDWLFEKKAS